MQLLEVSVLLHGSYSYSKFILMDVAITSWNLWGVVLHGYAGAVAT